LLGLGPSLRGQLQKFNPNGLYVSLIKNSVLVWHKVGIKQRDAV